MGVIQTILQNCRRCYSCVRECPAKAIKIVEGQASVVKERCIACGNCTVVCSQNAKAYASGIEKTTAALSSTAPVVAMVAPSFPADDLGQDPARLVGALRALGFAKVVEVAYGADLTNRAYRAFIKDHPDGTRLATACPAVVEYVRKYSPDLVSCLVPIVSPMIATAMAVKELYGKNHVCVFIGPCVAKKLEILDPQVPAVVESVLTFDELRRLFIERGVRVPQAKPSTFDPPRAGSGRLYPLVGGLLKGAGLERSSLNAEVMVLSGAAEILDVLPDLRPDDPQPLFIEPLMCRGCFNGPATRGDKRRPQRKRRVADYVKARMEEAPEEPTDLPPLDLERTFTVDDQRLKEPTEQEIRVILARTNKFTAEDELNCGACGYETCRAKAVAVYRGFAEEAMCLPFMIEQAERVCHELNVPWPNLKDIHRHLINTEKLASMGQMAAGVAHELNNPLGTILLYTNLIARKLKDRPDLDHDLKLLVDESNRCKKIIGNLLDFARQNRVQLERTNISELFQRVVEDSLFTLRDTGPGLRITCEAPPDLVADLDKDQIAQVLINLVKNAIEAMEGKAGTVRLFATTDGNDAHVRMTVTDQGHGIPPEARDKVFQPFFTTKSLGRGTGLGLPIAYGIVKMHAGRIWFDSEQGHGTTFFIELPKTQSLRRSNLYGEKPQDSVCR
jgi:nitrogen-specific signal transduction histidine kinase/iron only hydrogenase large subunit-like protein